MRRLTLGILLLAAVSQSGSAEGAATKTWRLVDAGGNAPRDGLYLLTSSDHRPRFVTQARGANGPAWSPDGTRIVFAQESETQETVDVVPAAGGRPKVLVKLPEPTVTHPEWSPDGERIAFLGVDGTVNVVDADGTNRRTVVHVAVGDFGWSPDGAKIVFTTFRGIFAVDLIRHTKRFLASGGVPSWSPDGRSIAYFRRCEALNGGGDDIACDLAIMNADGSGKRTLVGGRRVGPYVPVVWSRDSRAVYLNVAPKEIAAHVLSMVSVSTGRVEPIGPGAYNLVLAHDGRSLGFLDGGNVVITTLTGHVLARSALPANAVVDDSDLYLN
jgi:Tol biopolymer transport system component